MKLTLNVPVSSAPSDGWPVVLFLHGFKSGSEDENEKWLRENWRVRIRNTPPLRRCIVITPTCPRNRWWVPSSVVNIVSEVLKMKNLNIDLARLYILGFSMGAYCTWSILSRHPSLFAAAVAISGGGKPNGRMAFVCDNCACSCTVPLSLPLYFANVCHDTRSEFELDDLGAASTFMWAFHGVQDSIVPFQESVRNINSMPRELTRLTLYDKLTHEETFATVVLDINMYNWMLSKRSVVGSQRMQR